MLLRKQGCSEQQFHVFLISIETNSLISSSAGLESNNNNNIWEESWSPCSFVPPPGKRKIVGRGETYQQRYADYVLTSPMLEESVNTCVSPSLERSPQSPSSPASSGHFKRRATRSKQPKMECAFCKNNPKDKELYKTHQLKDSNNRVICPVLLAYVCPNCNNEVGVEPH